MPATLRVAGEGTEVHPIHTDATLGEVHEALVRAGGRRVSTSDDVGAGLELVILNVACVDSVVRAMVPHSPPGVQWLGIPVRWNVLSEQNEQRVAVRSWPIITELGPRAVVEIRVSDKNRVLLQRELLLVPGESLAMTASGGEWPVSLAQRDMVDSVAAQAFGWGGETPLALVLLVPRFQAR
jgi:hypothetical protein